MFAHLQVSDRYWYFQWCWDGWFHNCFYTVCGEVFICDLSASLVQVRTSIVNITTACLAVGWLSGCIFVCIIWSSCWNLARYKAYFEVFSNSSTFYMSVWYFPKKQCDKHSERIVVSVTWKVKPFSLHIQSCIDHSHNKVTQTTYTHVRTYTYTLMHPYPWF